MNIVIPKYSGFCRGVKRSIAAAYTHAKKGTRVYMYGEVVHNPKVMESLAQNGLILVQNLDEIPKDCKKDSKLLIRAHGVPSDVIKKAAEQGLEVIDMTCRHVKKIHEIVSDASARGLDVIVCGTPGHPEVEGIISRVSTQKILVQNLDETRRIIPTVQFSKEGVCLVTQTTHNKKIYEKIRAFLANECGNIPLLESHDTIECGNIPLLESHETIECSNIPLLEPHDTICDATAFRQDELRGLAKTADVCIIVGGKKSSNVTKLYEIAKEHCSRTQHIEYAGELDYTMLNGAENVVVAGGASTPNESVQEVVKILNGI
jgi:4-hydroxy-3-methylbut-2-enyl diphosphate reductase